MLMEVCLRRVYRLYRFNVWMCNCVTMSLLTVSPRELWRCVDDVVLSILQDVTSLDDGS